MKNNKNIKRVWDNQVPVYKNKTNKSIDAYLTDCIREPYYYSELYHLLLTADKETSFNIHINTPGGIIDSAFMLSNAIKQSKAYTTCFLSGTVASAGTLIALSCEHLEALPHLSFMIHNYSGGMEGKGHEMKARQKFTDEHLNEAFSEFYSGFLTEQEMNNVIDGLDIWMGSKEVTERWNNRVNLLKDTVSNN
jgi:ATP-dependent protease ClpP protease subunit